MLRLGDFAVTWASHWTQVNAALYELYLKSDELRDPLVSDYHALSLGWATQKQLDQMVELSMKSTVF